MAQSSATKTGDFDSGFLPPEVSQAYFDEARRKSVVQQLARQVPLGINGQEVPVVTSKASAGWVSEAGQKPSSKGSLGLKSMKPHKIAAISAVSAEVVRANPGNYMEILRGDISEAFAIAFDAAALHGTDSPFGSGNYLAATSKSATIGSNDTSSGSVYADVNDGLKALVDDDKKLTGFAFDSIAEPLFNSAVDSTGRPLFIDATYEDGSLRSGRLLGRSAFVGEGVADGDIVGFGGNWQKVIWGVVGGISYDVSTEATVTIDGKLVSLWENNLVAIRAEAEYGLLIDDVDSFVTYEVESEEP